MTATPRKLALATAAGVATFAMTAFLVAAPSTATLTWSGAGGDGNWSNGANWIGGVAPAHGDAVILSTTGGNPGNYDLPAGVQLLSVTLTNGPVNASLTVLGSPIALANNGSITNNRTAGNNTRLNAITLNGQATITQPAGAGVMNLFDIGGTGPLRIVNDSISLFRISGPSTYTGATTVDGSVLVLLEDAAFPSGSAVTVNGVARFVFSQTIGSLAGSGTVDTSGGTLTVGGDNTTTTFTGTYADGGSQGAGLTKVGTGTFTMSGANTHTGATTVSGGTLRAGAANTLSSGSAMSVSGGATLDLNSFNQTIGSLAGAGDVTLGSASLTMGGDNTSTTHSGVVAGTGSLTKNGTGTLTLSGNNTHSGGTSLAGGAIAVGSNTALGSGGMTATGSGTVRAAANGLSLNNTIAVSAGVTLTLDSQGNTITHAGTISGPGSVTKIGSGTVNLPAINTYSGGTTHSGGAIGVGANTSLGTGALTLTTAGSLVATANGLAISNPIALGANTLTIDTQANTHTTTGSITGTGGLTKTGTGTLTLSGAGNTYSAATTVSAGTLGAGAVNAFGSNSAVSVMSPATLNLNNLSQTIGSLAGGGSVALGTATLTAGGNNASTAYSGVITGNRLTKTGTGTLTLTGANTHTETVVQNGRVNFNGNQPASGVLLQGGIAGGTGTIGTFAATGGTLAPGLSPGLLTMADMTLSSGTTYSVELNGTTAGTDYDQARVTTGVVDLSDAALTGTVGFAPAAGTVFTIIDKQSGGAVTGTFNGLPQGAFVTLGGAQFAVSYTGGSGNDVTLTATGTALVAPATLPAMTVGEPFNTTITASGGVAPYTFAVTAGALPAGLALNAGTGVISGTPTTAGPYNFTITATDSLGVTDSQAYSGTVNAALALAPSTLPAMTVGEPVTVTFSASGGVGPFTFAVTAGALPAGLSLDASTGVLSGTPTTAGPFSFSITATDSTGATEVQAYSGTVAPAPVPSLPFMGLVMLALLLGGIAYARLRGGA